MKGKRDDIVRSGDHGYEAVLADVVRLIEAARGAAARSVNAAMTATYWAIGRSIVEEEQRGAVRAGYGERLVVNLSRDLQARFGRGFGRANLFQMKAFFLAYRDMVQDGSGSSGGDTPAKIVQSPSGLSPTTVGLGAVAPSFRLPWSHYVRLLGRHSRLIRLAPDTSIATGDSRCLRRGNADDGSRRARGHRCVAVKGS